MRDKIIKVFITIMLIGLPFLDMLRTTSFKDIEFCNIALIELINIVLIGVALLLTITKISKKKIMFLFVYLIVVGIYIVLHYNNIIKFDNNIFDKANFSFITETFYILRVYVLPLMLLFVLLNNKEIFDKKYYFKIAKWLIGIISFSIIILNILKLSYISYNDNSGFILYNIFDYFLFQGDFKQLSSRGFFDSANELSAILFMLLPLNIYMLYKEGRKLNVVLYVSQFIAMILLGTRTAAYGTLLISAAAGICYIALVLLKKEKNNQFFNNTFFVSSLVGVAFLSISPFMLGRINDGTPDFSIKDQSAYNEIENVDVNELDKLVEKYKSEYLINDYFLEMYPINKDPEFWLAMIKRDKALNNNNRIMKTDILNRVYERNDNPNDKFLGMGYTLNFIDIERDYYYQFYLFGIVGMIVLMGPYFILLCYLMVLAFKNFNRNFRFNTLLGGMSVVLGLIIAYYSGHVFGWVSPMMFLVLSLSILSIIIFDNNLENSSRKRVKQK